MVDIIIIMNHCQIPGYSLCQYFCLLCLVDPHRPGKRDTLLIIILLLLLMLSFFYFFFILKALVGINAIIVC